MNAFLEMFLNFLKISTLNSKNISNKRDNKYENTNEVIDDKEQSYQVYKTTELIEQGNEIIEVTNTIEILPQGNNKSIKNTQQDIVVSLKR